VAVDLDAKQYQIGNIAIRGGLEVNAHVGFCLGGVMFWSRLVRRQNIASPDGRGG
jgi:hypothetical protein